MKFNITLRKRSSAKMLGSCTLELEHINTLRDLLTHILLSELHKAHELTTLDQNQIQLAASLGKINFNERYNQEKTSDEEALEIMFQAFRDSLIRVFINRTEYTGLDDILSLEETNDVVIIRMVMLAGRRS